jgi:hypothetical protein
MYYYKGLAWLVRKEPLTCVCAQTNRSSLAKTIQIDHANPLSTKKVLLHALTFSPLLSHIRSDRAIIAIRRQNTRPD